MRVVASEVWGGRNVRARRRLNVLISKLSSKPRSSTLVGGGKKRKDKPKSMNGLSWKNIFVRKGIQTAHSQCRKHGCAACYWDEDKRSATSSKRLVDRINKRRRSSSSSSSSPKNASRRKERDDAAYYERLRKRAQGFDRNKWKKKKLAECVQECKRVFN